MKKSRKPARSKPERGSKLDIALFWLSMSLLILVPLALSTSIYTKYVLPKFVILLVGSSALLLLLAMIFFSAGAHPNPFRSNLTKIVCLYFIAVAVSTLFGVAPVTSLFGSHFNYMGLITRICFLHLFHLVDSRHRRERASAANGAVGSVGGGFSGRLICRWAITRV